MNDPATEQRGIYKGNETPQAAGNLPSSASGGLKTRAKPNSNRHLFSHKKLKPVKTPVL
jgi:hypothetical protein